jgi:transposase
MLYVGVDLHSRTSHLVALDESGEKVMERNIRSQRPAFGEALATLDGQPFEVVFEATRGWGWLADFLAELGVPAHMAHPLRTKAIASARVKNDAIDARTLAHLLRTNLLPESWMAPPEVRELRRLVRARASLVRLRTRLKQQVLSVLAEHGIVLEAADAFTNRGRAELAGVELPDGDRGILDASLRLVDGLTREVELVEVEMEERLYWDDRVQRLLPIPGIGFLTAATVVSEVWDVSRFTSAAHLCSWAGLTPREHSSAAVRRRGHISKQGSRWLRWVLVEAASTPRCRDAGLDAMRQRIAQRRGKAIARVAVARRLLTLCYYALRDERGCRAFPVRS